MTYLKLEKGMYLCLDHVVCVKWFDEREQTLIHTLDGNAYWTILKPIDVISAMESNHVVYL